MHLNDMPEPLIDLLYYDGPIHYISLDKDGKSIALFACDYDENTGAISYFSGEVSESDIRSIMLGNETICDFMRRVVTHKITWGGEAPFDIIPTDIKSFDEDYLPVEGYRF